MAPSTNVKHFMLRLQTQQELAMVKTEAFETLFLKKEKLEAIDQFCVRPLQLAVKQT